MKQKILVVAPHPDDEVIGVGGTLLRRKAEGATLAWVITTSVPADMGWTAERLARRTQEIRCVADAIGFDQVFELGLPAAQLDRVPMKDLVGAMAGAFREFEPDEVFVPHPGDVHTDHRAVFDAAVACTKWFRFPSVRRVLAYETLSETDFGLRPEQTFLPNVFVDIASYLDGKLEVMGFYASEMAAFPFPRSQEAIRALAAMRGAASGFRAAEAFQLLRERA
jgi:LmbE family N-acetylglucosaminyl deacetylase